MKVLTAFISVILFSFSLYAQKKGMESINIHDLKMHMKFLASDELERRDTGEPGLQVAARYLAVQAEQLGLQSKVLMEINERSHQLCQERYPGIVLLNRYTSCLPPGK